MLRDMDNLQKKRTEGNVTIGYDYYNRNLVAQVNNLQIGNEKIDVNYTRSHDVALDLSDRTLIFEHQGVKWSISGCDGDISIGVINKGDPAGERAYYWALANELMGVSKSPKSKEYLPIFDKLCNKIEATPLVSEYIDGFCSYMSEQEKINDSQSEQSRKDFKELKKKAKAEFEGQPSSLDSLLELVQSSD